MSTKTHQKLWQRFGEIKLGYIAIAFVVALMGSVWLLRRNNLHMVDLREAVTLADSSGGDVEKTLHELRSYVGGHMNTNLRSHGKFATDEPPIQLVNRYNQAVKEAQQKAATANGNAGLYAEAETNCTQRGVPLTAIASCIQDYIASRTNNSNPKVAATVPKELYTFDFVSPIWSPDAAGWSVILTSLFGAWLLIRLSLLLWRSHLLREA